MLANLLTWAKCETLGKSPGSRPRTGTSKNSERGTVDVLDALTVAAEGGKSEKAKPFHGVDGGVFEIASRYRGDAFVHFTR